MNPAIEKKPIGYRPPNHSQFGAMASITTVLTKASRRI